MSRYKKNFEALEKEKWIEFSNRISELPTDSFQNNQTALAELDRLILITQTIASSIESVQPFAEFINPDIQNQLKGFETNLNHLKNAQANQKTNLLNSLNNTATKILETIWPFVSKSDAARSAGQAFARYRKLIDNEEVNIRNIHSNAVDANSAIEKVKADLSAYRVELLEGTELRQSIKGEIDEKLSKIDDMLKNTDAFHQRLTLGDAETASVITQIDQAQNSAIQNSSQIAESLSDVRSKIEKLDLIYSQVVGLEVEGEEAQEGLKTQLDNRNTQLETMVDNFTDNFNRLSEKVESLLPGATSAGLATAYHDLKNVAEKRARRYTVAFFGLVAILTLTAAATVTQSANFWPPSWVAVTFSDATEYFTKLLFKLPVIIPVLWAALTVSKRRSEMHRLAEEYAHKEALAKSYEGFKKQILELDKDEKGLLTELLAAMLSAVSLNAAETLDGRHGEKMPVQEVIEVALKNAAKQTVQ